MLFAKMRTRGGGADLVEKMESSASACCLSVGFLMVAPQRDPSSVKREPDPMTDRDSSGLSTGIPELSKPIRLILQVPQTG